MINWIWSLGEIQLFFFKCDFLFRPPSLFFCNNISLTFNFSYLKGKIWRQTDICNQFVTIWEGESWIFFFMTLFSRFFFVAFFFGSLLDFFQKLKFLHISNTGKRHTTDNKFVLTWHTIFFFRHCNPRIGCKKWKREQDNEKRRRDKALRMWFRCNPHSWEKNYDHEAGKFAWSREINI